LDDATFLTKLKGWKTVAFNLIMPLMLLLAAYSPGQELPDGEQIQHGLDTTEAAITAIWTIGNLVLRAFSNTTIFKSTSPAPMPEAKPQ